MAIGDPYATLAELKLYADVTKATFDDLLTDALDAATEGIELVCDRQFNKETAATARPFKALTPTLVMVDDFHTTTGLVVATDEDGDGVYETTLEASSYQLEPVGGVVNGRPGWPFTRIRFLDGVTVPTGERASVQVTAQWGWAAVPKPVKQSCLILAEELYKLKDAPFGVAGNGTYGEIRVRENPMVMKKLGRFVRFPVAVA